MTMVDNTVTDESLTYNSCGKQHNVDNLRTYHDSEATFLFTIDDIHNLSNQVLSPATYVQGMRWQLLVMPHTAFDGSTIKTVGCFLACNKDFPSTTWSSYANGEIYVLPEKRGLQMIKKRFEHTFTRDRNDWGFRNMLSWSDAINPEKGYLSNGKQMTFGVHFCANDLSPSGVITKCKFLPLTAADDNHFHYCFSQVTFNHVVKNPHMLKEELYSPPMYVKGVPWRILIKLSAGNKSLGLFLVCSLSNLVNPWKCHALATLSLLPASNKAKTLTKKICHCYSTHEIKSGFKWFIKWDDAIKPDNGYVSETKEITFQVQICVDTPYGIPWNSKKITGYVGLTRQESLKFTNSLLQLLYFTNRLRKAVYLIPTENQDPFKSFPFALQDVFCQLQRSTELVNAGRVIEACGHITNGLYMHQSLKDSINFFLSQLEVNMQNTGVEGTIAELFQWKIKSYKKSGSPDFEEMSTFIIQFDVKDDGNIMKSFSNYMTSNKVDEHTVITTGLHLQVLPENTRMFSHLPPVLYIELIKSKDNTSGKLEKMSQQYKFPETLCLDKFLEEAIESNPAEYLLYGLLAEENPDKEDQHHVVFINANCDGKWFKIDDEVVSHSSTSQIFEQSFKIIPEVYLLVYIRKSKVSDVLCPLSDADVPAHLLQCVESVASKSSSSSFTTTVNSG